MNYDELTALEAEKAIIGGVLVDGGALLDGIGFTIEPRDFRDPYHELIWTAIHHRYKNDLPIDVVMITEDLLKYKRFNELPSGYLNELVSSIVTTKNAFYYAQIIRTNAFRMRTIKICEEVKQIALEGDFEEKEDLRKLVSGIADSVDDEIDKKVVTSAEFESEYLEHLRRKEHRIKTGFPQFDNWSGGIGRGWLYILAARPSVGKTAKMLQMAQAMATQQQGSIILFSQEMKKEDLWDRMVSMNTSISMNRFAEKDFDRTEELKITEALKKISAMDLHVIDSGSMTIEEIRGICKQIKRKKGEVGGIFIDYLGMMEIPIERNKTHSQSVGEITKKAKDLGVKINAPVILLCQMNREGAKGGKPSLYHLRDSGNIEQDADIVEFLWKDEEDTECWEHQDAVVIQSLIAKGRQIGVREFRYAFKGWKQKFYDLPPKNDR